ncbi:hypothetical protein GCM10028820_22510 [Tessaracoccus terricola]
MFVRRLLVAFAAFATIFGASLVPAQADTAPDQYSAPGVHLVNDRYWRTTCSMYSTTVVRCTTEIYGTKVFSQDGRWYKQNDWVFNNLTYLPSPRANWATNNLGKSIAWTAEDGRRWESECDTAATGRGACRQYVYADVASESGGVVKQERLRVFNSLVKFQTGSTPWVSQVPAAVAARTDVPVATAPVLLTPAKPVVAKPAPVVAPKPTSYAPSGRNCPSNAPIKGNHSSSGEYIYHVPGGQFYDRTNPERCFTTEAAARAAGFRASKR